MSAARHRQAHRYRGPKDLLARLERDLDALHRAGSPAIALDRVLAFAATAWNMANWFYLPIRNNAVIKRQLSRMADPAMIAFNEEDFSGLMAELCPELQLCADILANPHCLLAVSTGAGWLLLYHEDGEDQPVDLERLAAVLTFWRKFERDHLRDAPIVNLATARMPLLRRRSNGEAKRRAAW